MDDPKLDISALIDVSFLLLIFFLVATSIVRKEQDLSISHGISSEAIPPSEVLRIDLNQEGEITLRSGQNVELVESGGSGSDLPNLRGRLQLVQDISSVGPVVQVSSEEGSQYQRFIDILNCLAEVKIESVGIVDSGETFQ